VGITRKTGYRWRAENGGVPPAGLDEETRSNRYLSLLERQRIATLHGQGLGVREIARRVDRSPSTVSRELRRNVRPHWRNVDDADLAHARVRERARRTRASPMLGDEELRREIQAKLELEWSPEQIANHLRCAFPQRPEWHLVDRASRVVKLLPLPFGHSARHVRDGLAELYSAMPDLARMSLTGDQAAIVRPLKIPGRSLERFHVAIVDPAGHAHTGWPNTLVENCATTDRPIRTQDCSTQSVRESPWSVSERTTRTATRACPY
jgi:hypothetical protein